MVERTVRLDPAPPPFAPAISMVECGFEVTPPGHRFPPRRIAAAALVATEAGCATARVNGREVVHRPGTLLAVAPGFDLLERGDARSSWTARWCLLEGPWAQHLGQTLATQPAGLLVVPRAPRLWLHLLTELFDLLSQPGQDREWTAIVRLGGLLAAVAREAGRHDRVDAPLCERLRALIDESPDRDWTLDEAAAELRLPRSVLAHRFSRETGEPPARFLRRRRCEHARHLLERGLSVREVGERLGFPDQFQFSRCYRTVMGVPPSQARTASGLRG